MLPSRLLYASLVAVVSILICDILICDAKSVAEQTNSHTTVVHCDCGACDRCCHSCRSACAEIPLENYRRSFYQGSEILGGYLIDTGNRAGGMDQTVTEVRASFGLPLGSMDHLLGFRPYLRVDHLNGPKTIDLPETLYDTGVTMLHQMQWTEKLSSTVVVSPSVRSDMTTSQKAFRLFGLAMMNWQARSDLSLSLGVVYFDRADFGLLPAVGARWTPTPRWRIDATMPRPGIARRLWKHGGDAEGWAYLGGRIGGNTWAVSRDRVGVDELTLRDLRLLFGYEVLRNGNRGLYIESGYAFDRTIEYERQDIDIHLDSGLFVLAGWKF